MDAHADRQTLFPRIEPYGKGMLALGDGHEMYWEQSGNPDGRPVVFLHGGPGAGANPAHRRFFDPRFYRIIIFDQRGAGRSTPAAELSGNTTEHLIGDIEALRRHLEVDRWLVFGGSWGSTLALAYGIRHPERCAGFILRGIFLGDTRELDWFLKGMRTVFPEAWKAFSDFLSDDERGDIAEAYFNRLNDPDPAVHLPAAEAWNRYEGACSTLRVNFAEAPPPSGGATAQALGPARIEAHYFRNAMFLEDGYLLNNIGAVRDIPAVLVQGRYDMICPIITADKLAAAWDAAEYVIVPDAGHSAMEPGIMESLIRATEDFKGRLLPE
ncbi:MAG: prolyl aminopeptidase [Alphaproteobacteria bacterium]|nr:prolyl aminopeptidase [Alphaproteobacteria bacterium]